MQDAQFSAQLKKAVLTAREEDEKVIRRVQFTLVRTFTIEIAEWLGNVAMNQRDLMVNGDIETFEIAIDAYHAKASFSGTAGNAEVDVDGLKVVASIKKPKGDDGEQLEVVALSFEAFPFDKLLTFLAAHMKEYIDCDFKRSQLTTDQVPPKEPKEPAAT